MNAPCFFYSKLLTDEFCTETVIQLESFEVTSSRTNRELECGKTNSKNLGDNGETSTVSGWSNLQTKYSTHAHIFVLLNNNIKEQLIFACETFLQILTTLKSYSLD